MLKLCIIGAILYLAVRAIAGVILAAVEHKTELIILLLRILFAAISILLMVAFINQVLFDYKEPNAIIVVEVAVFAFVATYWAISKEKCLPWTKILLVFLGIPLCLAIPFVMATFGTGIDIRMQDLEPHRISWMKAFLRSAGPFFLPAFLGCPLVILLRLGVISRKKMM